LKLLQKPGNIKKMTSKIKKFIKPAVFQIFLLLAVSNTVMAGTTCSTGSATDCLSQGKTGQIMQILQIGINVLAAAVGVIAVIMLIIGGIQYSSSNGNPQAVTAAKQRIINVLMGLVAFIFLYAFLQWLIPGGSSIF
jgi:hypothetical protein